MDVDDSNSSNKSSNDEINQTTEQTQLQQQNDIDITTNKAVESDPINEQNEADSGLSGKTDTTKSGAPLPPNENEQVEVCNFLFFFFFFSFYFFFILFLVILKTFFGKTFLGLHF